MPILWLFVFLLLAGCAPKGLEESVRQEPVRIYTIQVDRLFFQEGKGRERLLHFPFVSLEKGPPPKGKFSDAFYEGIDQHYEAKALGEVNFWQLEEDPKALDIIYALPIWINDYKDVSSDLLTNICYSLNVGPEEQGILKDWIAQGGVLWLESGLYSTKYDHFTRSGEIATSLIRRKVKGGLQGKKLLGKPIRTYLFQGKNLDLVNYLPRQVTFEVVPKDPFFEGVKRLRLDVRNYLQNHFVVLGKPLVSDRNGQPLVTILQHGRGFVVTLLPFEYRDVYYDGELLRWKLLYYFLKRR
ncbi:MAG: hypothetical protein C6I00_04645 [Nitratiruptor sp.]|nr:hypothetical protein [Nitratiruptor sp.]NPA84197.1 hypothetical protein [Campylobacterota bacterium]